MRLTQRRTIQVVAHRGASGHAPETTMEAYRLALDMGADSVEADIHRLGDGTLVAMHDPDVRRTTNGSGKLSDLTLAELKTLDAGSWFNKRYPEKANPMFAGLTVPTLREILELLRESAAGCCIEIKDPERYPPTLESELISLVYECGMERRVRMLSFSAQSIRKIKMLDRSIPTALLISKREKDPVDTAANVPADELAIRHDLLTETIVHAARDHGISLAAWTADREKDMLRLIAQGVDRIITNYPDRLLRLL